MATEKPTPRTAGTVTGIERVKAFNEMVRAEFKNARYYTDEYSEPYYLHYIVVNEDVIKIMH